jgi:hypothetical protein
MVSMFATTGSAALSVSRVSYLTRLSVENPELIFSNDVVVADIFDSMVPARAGLRPDRVPDMIAVLSPHRQIHLRADEEVNAYINNLGRPNFKKSHLTSAIPSKITKGRAPIPNIRKRASLGECIVRKIFIKTLSRCDDGCRVRHLVRLLELPHGSNGSISMTIAVMSIEQGSIVTSPIEKSAD